MLKCACFIQHSKPRRVLTLRVDKVTLYLLFLIVRVAKVL